MPPVNPRILMIISQFYPLRGGAEQQALQLATGLIRAGVQVSVLTRRIPGLPAYEVISGIPVYRSIRTVPAGKLFGLLYSITVFFFLFKKRTTYDIIHCHLAQGFHSAVALFFKAVFKKKVIIKVGATGPLSDFRMLREVLLGSFLVRLLRHADRIITVCGQATAEAVRAGIPDCRIAQIPNGVDLQRFNPSRERATAGLITFVGRLDYMKGVHVLLEAFAMLRQRGAPAFLRIIGDGPDREKLVRMADALHLGEQVAFSGVADDIPVRLQASAVLVLPSLSEGLSNVVLEAMACGLPVVATRVGGTAELLEDNVTGILVEPGSPEKLCEALWRVLDDVKFSESLGRRAWEKVESCFAMSRVIDGYRDLYRKLLSTDYS